MSNHQLISVQLAARNYGYELCYRPQMVSRLGRGVYEVLNHGRVVFTAQTLGEVQLWLQDQ